MLDIFGKQIEQQDLDVSATVGSTGSLMLVCSTGGGDCRGNLADCRPMSGFGRWISLAFLSLPENNTLKLLVIAHNRFGEDGMLTLAHVQPQAWYVVLRRQRYICSQGYPSSLSIPPKLEGVSMAPKQGSLTMSEPRSRIRSLFIGLIFLDRGSMSNHNDDNNERST